MTTSRSWLVTSITRVRSRPLAGRLIVALSPIAFALLTGLCARVRVYVPFTPVPITGQVFAVLLSGFVLGGWLGSLSQVLYVTLGLLGVDWFVLGPLGPTWGYIVGFILAPVAVSLLRERNAEHDGWRDALALLAGVSVIYCLGTVHFALYTGMSAAESIRYTVIPFLPFDAGKAFLVFMIARPAGARSARGAGSG